MAVYWCVPFSWHFGIPVSCCHSVWYLIVCPCCCWWWAQNWEDLQEKRKTKAYNSLHVSWKCTKHIWQPFEGTHLDNDIIIESCLCFYYCSVIQDSMHKVTIIHAEIIHNYGIWSCGFFLRGGAAWQIVSANKSFGFRLPSFCTRLHLI